MARFLVTGVAGFIGARVAEMLLHEGHEVVGVDNMNNAYDVRLKEYRLGELQKKSGFEFFKRDISEREAVDSLPVEGEPYQAVINLAARAGVRASVLDPWVYVATNMTGTLNLLEFCRNHHIGKFILASTSSIYGADAPLPTPEDTESSRPLQPYAASKKGAEAMAHAYHFLYGLDVTVFRYFTVYGPAGRPDMVMFRFTQRLREGLTLWVNGDGQQSRGFTYVDDIATGTLMGLKKVGYEIFNLGGHEVVTINDLIHMLETRMGREATIEHRPRHPADMLTNWADTEKVGRMLGWEPRFGIGEGLDRLIEWYEVERDWARAVDTGD